MTLDEIQETSREWRRLNFPANTRDEQFMGMVEEIGEISHALLKNKQGIRGFDDPVKFESAVMDGLGDLIIFACGFADHLGITLSQAVALAWAEVQERDWITAPDNGQLTIDTP